MAILDTFYLLFKADTTDLTKGADKALTSINNLKSAVLAAIPVGFFTAGIKHAIDLGVELAKTGRALNVNVQDLSAWRNAVELAGGNASAFENTISSLADKFGVSSAVILKILPKYADALSKINPARAQQIGKNLGLDEGTILLLQHGRREVEAMINKQKELGVVTQKDAEQYLKYNEATIKVKQSTQALFSVLALEALPHLIKFFTIIGDGIEYFIHHKDFVIGGIYAIGAALGFLAIRAVIAGLPFYLMSALIVGLIGLFALVYDDIQAFLKGNNSIIGLIVDKYPQATAVIKKFFGYMSEAIHAVLHPLETLEAALKKIEELFDKVLGSRRQTLIDQFKGANSVIDQKVNALLNPQNSATGSKTTNVNVGEVTVNTQATDAKGIASELANQMNQQLAQVANFHADGVNA